MWLTGFDAPVLHTLYVDKPMRDHGLLQAIARVNRVFRDKPGGLVVDYIGIGEDLRASLQRLRRQGPRRAGHPRRARGRRAVGEVRGHLRAASPDRLPRRASFSARPTRRSCSGTAYNLHPRDRRAHAATSSTRRRRWRGGTRSRAPSRPRSSCATTSASSTSSRPRSARSPPRTPKPATPPSRRSASSSPRAWPPARSIDIFGIADKDRPEISVLSDEFLDSITKRTEHPNVQVRLLEKLLNDEIRSRARTSQTQAKVFSEEVQAVLQRYELKQLTSAEVVERLVEIAKQPARRATPPRAARPQPRGSRLLRRARRRRRGREGRSRAGEDRPRARREHPHRPHRRLGRPRAATEAKIRAKIKRLLRKHKYRPPRRDGWRWRRSRRRLRRAARPRPGEGALPLLARRGGRRPALQSEQAPGRLVPRSPSLATVRMGLPLHAKRGSLVETAAEATNQPRVAGDAARIRPSDQCRIMPSVMDAETDDTPDPRLVATRVTTGWVLSVSPARMKDGRELGRYPPQPVALGLIEVKRYPAPVSQGARGHHERAEAAGRKVAGAGNPRGHRR